MIGAIIQARMGSTRLPGKAMKKVLGRPLLFYLLERLKLSRLIEMIVLAIPDRPADRELAGYAESRGVKVFLGSEDDVLDRYYQAARAYGIDTVVRVTADCPLIDPEIMDTVIKYYLDHPQYDLVSTGETYPEGLDTEVFSFKSLKTAWREAKIRSEREHVTVYIKKSDKKFKSNTLAFEQDLSYLRLTVDEAVDIEVVSSVLERLYRPDRMFYLKDILDLYERHPEIFLPNRHVVRNEGYLKSLAGDREVEHA